MIDDEDKVWLTSSLFKLSYPTLIPCWTICKYCSLLLSGPLFSKPPTLGFNYLFILRLFSLQPLPLLLFYIDEFFINLLLLILPQCLVRQWEVDPSLHVYPICNLGMFHFKGYPTQELLKFITSTSYKRHPRLIHAVSHKGIFHFSRLLQNGKS